jgi:tRNA threonylcarbamoyladenosine biosynthesis protein TsaE
VTSVLKVTSHSESETEALAGKLVVHFKPGDAVILTGELGAGKTAFVRGLACGLGIDEQSVNSPSYAIVNEYPGNSPLYHFDLYRLGDESELSEVGLDDYLSRNGLVVMEWGERAGSWLPDKYYRLTFRVIDATTREIELEFVSE